VEEIDALIYPIRYNTQQANTLPNMGIDPAIFAQLPQAARDLLARSVARNVGRGQSEAEYQRGREYLDALATTSGGRSFDADSIQNMEASFSNVAEELRRQYSLGYYSNKEGQPGDRKHIKIQVLRPGSVVRSKTTYIVKDKEEPRQADTTNSGAVVTNYSECSIIQDPCDRWFEIQYFESLYIGNADLSLLGSC
jgi:hypothetical protein